MFEVTMEDIQQLNATQLVDLLRRLLILEATTHAVQPVDLDVPLNITSKDGGVDASIAWQLNIKATPYLPSNKVIFQCKATYKSGGMGPAACAKEIAKPISLRVLREGGSYIIFCTEAFTASLMENRLTEMWNKLLESGWTNQTLNEATKNRIRIYDANKIREWVNVYIGAITAIHEYLGKPIPSAAKTFEEWSKYIIKPKTQKYVHSDFTIASSEEVYLKFLRKMEIKIFRVFGESGCGKTRFVYELLRYNQTQENFSTNIQKSTIYIDATDPRDLIENIESWVRQGRTGILIVDKCDKKLHKKLFDIACTEDCKFKIITIGLKPVEQLQGLLLLDFNKKLDIEKILECYSPTLNKSQIDVLDEISFNNIGLALEFASIIDQFDLTEVSKRSYLKYVKIIKTLLSKKLMENSNPHKIMLALALFEKIGWLNEQREHYKFVAKSIIDIDPNEFFAFMKRELINKNRLAIEGDFVFITPKPLKTILAAVWWNECSPDRAYKVIEAILNSLYVEDFFKSLASLNTLPSIIDDIETIFNQQRLMSLFNLENIHSLAALKSLALIIPSFVVKVLEENKNLLSFIDEQHETVFYEILENLCYHESSFEFSILALLQKAEFVSKFGFLLDENQSLIILKRSLGTSGAPTLVSYQSKLKVLQKISTSPLTKNAIFPHLLSHICSAFVGTSSHQGKELVIGGKKAKYPPDSLKRLITEQRPKEQLGLALEEQNYVIGILEVIMTLSKSNNQDDSIEKILLEGLFFRHIFDAPHVSLFIIQRIIFRDIAKMAKFLENASEYINAMKIDRNSKDEFEIEWKNYIEYAKSQLVEIKKIVAVNLSDNSKVGINLSNDTVTLKPCLKTFIFKEIIYREMRSKDAGKECIIKVFCESLAFDQDNLMDRFSRQNTSAIMPFPDELTIINKYRDIFEERCKFSIRLFENPKWNQMKDFFFSGDFFCDKRCQTHYFSYKLKAMKKRLDTTKHSEYVEALHYLGEIYLSINSVDSLKWAISKFSKVIAICDELNENKIRTMAVGNLISAYVSCAYILSKQKQDRFALKAALSFYESALSLIETNQHPYDGEKKVVLLNNIGICNLELFDENSSNYTIDDVLSCFKQSIYEAEQSFGLRCIQSVDALIYAGAICASQNEVKQAYEFFQAAWDVRAAHLGSTHPDTISINNILDDMCMKLGIFS